MNPLTHATELPPLDLIHVFLTVAEVGGFTRAAEQLNLPVASVSRKISKLERTVSTVLFKRNTRRVSLTGAGEEFYERVAPALRSVQDALTCLTDANAQLRGTIRITTPADFAGRALAPLLTKFLQLYPDISVQLDLSMRVVDLISEQVDLAIRIGHLSDSNLYARFLFNNQLKLFASPSCLAALPPIRTPEDLSQHNLLYLKLGPAQRKIKLETVLTSEPQSVLIATQSNLQMNDMNALIHFCETGAGVALLPTMFVQRHVEQGRLCEVLPEWWSDTIPVHAVTTSRNPPARVRRLIEFLVAHTSEDAAEVIVS